MRLADVALVQVWIVSADEVTIGCRDARHRLLERVVTRAIPLARTHNVSWTASRDTLAVAMSGGLSVGVDLERCGGRRGTSAYLAALAASCLSAREALAFERVDAADKANWLLRRWTAKEAHLKRTGAGLRTAPSTIEIDWHAATDDMSGLARAITSGHRASSNGGLSHLICYSDAPASYVCSLACERSLGSDEVVFKRVVYRSALYQPSMLNTAQATGPSAVS